LSQFDPRSLQKGVSNLRYFLAFAFFLNGVLAGMTVDFLFFRKVPFILGSMCFLVASIAFTHTLIKEWGWILEPYILIPSFLLGLGVTLPFLEIREI